MKFNGMTSLLVLIFFLVGYDDERRCRVSPVNLPPDAPKIDIVERYGR